MQDWLDAILAITEEAAALPQTYFRQGVDVIQKADETPVTVADREVESFLRAAIERHFPGHAIFGEEFGETGGDGPYRWIIDPIDGTRSFISGMPLFGMLVGLLEHGKPVLGTVRLPALGEVYYGSGAGAFDGAGQRLSTSKTASLDTAFLYINEADKILRAAPETFHRLNRAGKDRRFAYDCYPHALVAAGHVDACVDFDLQPYDYLPLVPVIEAAGGVITDWRGERLAMQNDEAVVSAATPALHAELIALLNKD
ncbi:MAG: inositol monophosphatase family protein [Paracoccaceae bacterium]